MRKRRLLRISRPLLFGFLALQALAAPAEFVRYAVEQSEFAIRSGKSYKNESLGTIKSAEQVTVIEEDIVSGWSRIKTLGGGEGWIQSKYLTDTPHSSRCPSENSTDLIRLRSENQRLTKELTALRNVTPVPTAPQLSATIVPCPTAAPAPEPNTAQVTQLEADLAAARSELAQVKTTVGEVRAVQRNWFLGGALITLLGALVGRLLARTAWARD
jgi:SH3 domain protein